MGYLKKTDNRPWTEADLDEVETLLKQGLNPKQIGAEIGRSRNAVIGIVWRRAKLREANRERVQGMKPEERWPNRWKKGEAPVPPPRVEQPSVRLRAEIYDARALKISLVDLHPNQCRYPFGDFDFTFCGWAAVEGSAYCEHHRQRCLSAVRVAR